MSFPKISTTQDEDLAILLEMLGESPSTYHELIIRPNDGRHKF